jgi:hypothetical protein
MPGGRPPTPTAILIARGTYRADRHANRIDAPGSVFTPETQPSELSAEQQAERRREIDAMRQRLYGEGRDGIDAGPRSGGNVKRLRW